MKILYEDAAYSLRSYAGGTALLLTEKSEGESVAIIGQDAHLAEGCLSIWEATGFTAAEALRKLWEAQQGGRL
ncbi:MAG: hypothetical protein KGI70_03280 [Patescibacteria group bacterium]|nr:hypothetical protein [Patescibacteria group bacterium]